MNDSSRPYSYLDCFDESCILCLSGGQKHYRLKVRLPANRISIKSENATSLRSSFVQINCIITINKPSIVYTTSFSFRSFINETNILSHPLYSLPIYRNQRKHQLVRFGNLHAGEILGQEDKYAKPWGLGIGYL